MLPAHTEGQIKSVANSQAMENLFHIHKKGGGAKNVLPTSKEGKKCCPLTKKGVKHVAWTGPWICCILSQLPTNKEGKNSCFPPDIKIK